MAGLYISYLYSDWSNCTCRDMPMKRIVSWSYSRFNMLCVYRVYEQCLRKKKFNELGSKTLRLIAHKMHTLPTHHPSQLHQPALGLSARMRMYCGCGSRDYIIIIIIIWFAFCPEDMYWIIDKLTSVWIIATHRFTPHNMTMHAFRRPPSHFLVFGVRYASGCCHS